MPCRTPPGPSAAPNGGASVRKNDGASRARIPQTNAEKKGSLAMNAMIYKKKGPLVLFLVPTFLFLAMYLYYPFLMNIYNSLNKIGGLGESSRGLNEPVWENYVKMFTDPLMRTALKNTMILMILTVVFQVGIALVLALMVDISRWGRNSSAPCIFFPSSSAPQRWAFCST